MKPALLLLLSIFALGGCATTTPASPEDKAAFAEADANYERCLGSTTQKNLRGSDDVALLVKQSLDVCEPLLDGLYSLITSRGRSDAYAAGYVHSAREDGRILVTAHILEDKSKNR